MSPKSTDSVENLRNQGLANGKPAVLVILYRQPGANIIDTVDRVKAIAAAVAGLDPARDIDVTSAMDRTTTIRASLHDVERDAVDRDRPRHPRRLRVPAQLRARP